MYPEIELDVCLRSQCDRCARPTHCSLMHDNRQGVTNAQSSVQTIFVCSVKGGMMLASSSCITPYTYS